MALASEMMREAADAIVEQGATLDRIDGFVTDGKDNTAQGVLQLEKTDRRQRTKKKWLYAVLGGAFVLVLALVVIVVVR